MTKINTPFLQSLYDNCKELGLVQNQHQFSELCGRRTTWFSASKSRDLPISNTAAYTLSVRLRDLAKNDLPRKLKPVAYSMSALLMALVNERLGIKS